MSGPPKSLAERAGRPAGGRTAQEALEEARRAEERRKEAKAREKEAAAEEARLAEERRAIARKAVEEARQRLAAQQRQQEAQARATAEKEAARRRVEAQEAEDQAARDRAAFGGRRAAAEPTTGSLARTLAEGRVTAVLERLDAGFVLQEVWPDVRPEIQVVLWQAHAKRARHAADLPATIAAHAVATALAERPKAVLAARATWGEAEWAVWVDTERKEILAALQPAERFLTGL